MTSQQVPPPGASADEPRPRTSLSSDARTDSVFEKPVLDATPTTDADAGSGATADAGPPADEENEYYKPKTLRFWLVIASTFVTMFLVALDRTILATAIPRITDEFKSLGDIGWYGSAYMLATAAFQLVFGRIYTFYDLKWTLLTCIFIFEVGSAICGAAPNSPVFILGRSIAGIGSAGIMTGSIMTVVPLVPLHKRPMFQALFAVVFGVASVSGPLIGGAFTDRVTWRWCFYLNLPIGAAAFAFLATFKFPTKPKSELSVARQILQLDPIGTLFFVPAVASLLLALQWGGSTYEWSNWRIIVLFVCFGIGAVAFITVQIMMPDSASLPVRVIKQRAVYLGGTNMFFLSGSMMLCVYYIPFWFQTTQNVNPVDSGVYTIPLVLSLVVGSIVSGAISQKCGYVNPSMIFGVCFNIIGEGLLTTFTPTTGSPHWIGYQFLTGFGIGFGMQAPNLAIQASIDKKDIPTGMAITFFAQQLGGAIFVTVGQTILSTVVVSRLAGLPGLDANAVIRAGATELHKIVKPEYIPNVIDAFNHACVVIFLTAVVLTACQVLTVLGMPWASIKKGAPKKTKPEQA